jgi:colanic acid biosynthesis protein WcaH
MKVAMPDTVSNARCPPTSINTYRSGPNGVVLSTSPDVTSVPLVSVDLVVRHDGGAVLGRRQNEPAKGEWFVPGGRVHKDERLTDAVHRVARTELGSDVTATSE